MKTIPSVKKTVKSVSNFFKSSQSSKFYMIEFGTIHPTQKRGICTCGLDMMNLLEIMMNVNAFGKTVLVLDEEGYYKLREIEKSENNNGCYRFATYEEIREFAIYFDTTEEVAR